MRKLRTRENLSNFKINKGNTSGLNSKMCKNCLEKRGESWLTEYLTVNEIYKKSCKQCEIEKDYVEYHKSPYNKDSLQNVCKDCAHERVKLQQSRNREKNKNFLIDLETSKRCSECEKDKKCKAFHKNICNFDNLESSCKDCKKERTRNYYTSNSEALREKSKTFSKKQ